MMPGDAPCMHLDGEFCHRCFPVAKKQVDLQKRVEHLEKVVDELVTKIADIANWCYREK